MQRWLQRVAQLLDSCFVGRPTAELFTVMICCPLLMNMVQVRAAACRVLPDSAPAPPWTVPSGVKNKLIILFRSPNVDIELLHSD